MISAKDAAKIVSKYIEVDACEEYEKGYVFYPPEPEEFTVGGDEPLAVMKDTGEIKPLFLFFILEDNELISDNVEVL